ncbi:MAG: hypothetical protein HYX73_03405 [Acidobacteria bacterium]|nr:hypothetical protein [Acidobacteriota bacterium]
MMCNEVMTEGKLCQQCGNPIEEGCSRNKPPTEAKYCLRCRAARRRRANLKYVWRPEYDDYLKGQYYGGLDRRFQVLNRMIRETGLPRWYIKRRAARLGLTMHQDRRPWTAAEEEIIERLVGKVSALTIAKRLRRTEASVVLKIKRMGLSRRVRDGYTMRDLEDCLGESHKKIQRWIENGWLRNRLQGTRRHNGNGRDIHRFREANILDFIQRHPEELNLGKVDSIWFLDLVLLNGKEIGAEIAARPNGESEEAA